MNKHVELVKRWLDDPDSVTQEELDLNADVMDQDSADAMFLRNKLDAANAAFWAAKAEENDDD
jgi:hypothetical protein